MNAKVLVDLRDVYSAVEVSKTGSLIERGALAFALMPAPILTTVRVHLAWSYANLAAHQMALAEGRKKHKPTDWMVRAKLFAGLRDGRMAMGSLLDDEREALNENPACAYCGLVGRLSLDHLLPRSLGGLDAHNLVRACRSCNSSKGARDLLEWHAANRQFPRLMILRRYLKLIAKLCEQHGLLDCPIDDPRLGALPFSTACLVIDFPPLRDLKL